MCHQSGRETFWQGKANLNDRVIEFNFWTRLRWQLVLAWLVQSQWGKLKSFHCRFQATIDFSFVLQQNIAAAAACSSEKSVKVKSGGSRVIKRYAP